jgi:hypothetical protein
LLIPEEGASPVLASSNPLSILHRGWLASASLNLACWDLVPAFPRRRIALALRIQQFDDTFQKNTSASKYLAPRALSLWKLFDPARVNHLQHVLGF